MRVREAFRSNPCDHCDPDKMCPTCKYLLENGGKCEGCYKNYEEDGDQE